MPKYIFVTGGVVSSVGKGITTAALGRILKSRGVTVSVQKLDPYLNVDPGTMSPYQHGEVFVTADGAETDLDLGHYERFIDEDLTRASSLSMGQVYNAVIQKERRGDFLGGTIQAVPHLTQEIKARIRGIGRITGAQAVIIEVGGTVGDIEGQVFLEAIRQIRREEDPQDTLSIHVTYLPYIGATEELKTKPTQHSVQELRRMGIQPDVILCRSDHPVPDDTRDKIALFCDVIRRAVIPVPTVRSIYEVPALLEDSGLGDYVIERLGIEARERDLADWRRLVDRMLHPSEHLKVAVVGKYVELRDAYMSVKEALIHAGAAYDTEIEVLWVQSEEINAGNVSARLRGVDAIVVPGGFGERGVEGKVEAARWARENRVPYLGLCLGMQVMVVEAARTALGTDAVNSTEFDTETPAPRYQPALGAGGRRRQGRHDAPRRLSLPPLAGQPGAGSLRHGRRTRASPPPLRVQQPLPRRPRRFRTRRQRALAGRQPRRGLRDPRPPVHGRHAVPPRVPLPAGPPAPAIPRADPHRTRDIASFQ